jgi:CheY-like chemotaxis protein
MEKATVLLVEDEENDVFFIRRAIQKMSEPVSLQTVRDGMEAIEYLDGHNRFSDRERYPLPALILLDVKMPRKSGFDVLEWVKGRQALAGIPIVMVTSSTIKTDMDKSFELGARAYLVKPIPFDDLKRLLVSTEEFLSAHAP